MTCLFCSIAKGLIPAAKVYEDQYVVAFLDIAPVHPGHTLVVPKAHAKNLLDISPESWEAVARVTRLMADAVKQAVDADGISIAMNNEPAAGQVIDHAHVHVIPRYADDAWPHWPKQKYAEGALAATQQKIKDQL